MQPFLFLSNQRDPTLVQAGEVMEISLIPGEDEDGHRDYT